MAVPDLISLAPLSGLTMAETRLDAIAAPTDREGRQTPAAGAQGVLRGKSLDQRHE